jgi:putative phage-type endonuclease
MLTNEQRQLRRGYVGSSDSPAICGVDLFKTPWDVWAEKTGHVEPFAGNEATERGNLLEPVILNWAERELGVPFRRDIFHGVSRGDARLCANLDAECVVDGAPVIVEAKSATNPDEWGQEGTAEVPERVLVQTHHAMAVTGYKVAYVPVLLPVFNRFEFRLYRVERNDQLAQAIAAEAEKFWTEYVVTGTPPPDSEPSLEVLRRVRRIPEKVVDVSDEIVDAWRVLRSARLKAEDEEQAAQAAVIAALGDAEAGQCPLGRLVTYFETTRKEHVVKASTFRQLRLKAAKESL